MAPISRIYRGVVGLGAFSSEEVEGLEGAVGDWRPDLVNKSAENDDFHSLVQDPRALELIFKPREAQRIIDFDTFWKGVSKAF